MDILAKNKISIGLLLLIITFYFILRLPNLTMQPIFADEAIYIRWAQVMRSEPTLRFLPLSDGKTPLFMWAMIPMLKLFDDPLFAGRVLSVFSGFLTLIGVFLLTNKVFNSKAALIASFLYTVVPYTLFFDRLALVDSMLTTFTVWAIFFAVLLLSKPRLDWSMILGYFLGGALLVKTPAMFNLLVLPLSILGFDFKKDKKNLIRLLISWTVAGIIALAIYNILRLGPNFQLLSSRNSDYIFSLTELKNRPLDPFIPHFGDVRSWFVSLISVPVTVFIIVGVGFTVFNKSRLGMVILLWSLVPALIQTGVLKTFTARYILPSIPPLLIIGAYGVEQSVARFKKEAILIPVVVLLAVMPLYNSYLLITDPAKASLPPNERRGYLEDWTAGYSFKQTAKFLEDKKRQGPVVVGTEGYFGTLPDGLQIYLDKSNIPIVGGGATVSAKLRESAKDNTTYYIGNRNRIGDNVPNAKLIMKFEKAQPLGNFPQDAIVVYQVFP